MFPPSPTPQHCSGPANSKELPLTQGQDSQKLPEVAICSCQEWAGHRPHDHVNTSTREESVAWVGGIASGEQKSPPLLQSQDFRPFSPAVSGLRRAPARPSFQLGCGSPEAEAALWAAFFLMHSKRLPTEPCASTALVICAQKRERLLSSPSRLFPPFSPSLPSFLCSHPSPLPSSPAPSHPSAPPPPPRKQRGFVTKPGFVLRETGFHVSL